MVILTLNLRNERIISIPFHRFSGVTVTPVENADPEQYNLSIHYRVGDDGSAKTEVFTLVFPDQKGAVEAHNAIIRKFEEAQIANLSVMVQVAHEATKDEVPSATRPLHINPGSDDAS